MAPHVFAAFAAEFPNDNSELHLGTIWMCEGVCGPVVAHLPEERLADPVEEKAVEPVVEDEEEAIEIVESIVLEGLIEIVPAPLESGVVASAPDVEAEDEAVVAEATAEEPVVAEMFAGEPAEPERPAPLISTPPPPISDPFEAFLQTLSDVACDSGQTFAASEIGAALAGDPVALAWRAILNGESEDFSLCAVPLDEWASGALARFLSAPHKAAQLRRELRARGVAAFGLVEAA